LAAKCEFVFSNAIDKKRQSQRIVTKKARLNNKSACCDFFLPRAMPAVAPGGAVKWVLSRPDDQEHLAGNQQIVRE
jgi:hypothetical protein